MQIVAVMRQNEIRNKLLFQFFELSFDPSMKRREKTVAIVANQNFLSLCRRKKEIRSSQSFLFSNLSRAKYEPADFNFRIFV